MKQNTIEAKKAYDKSYSPYSNFAVGAALKLKDGTYIHGANIENGSYGLSNCAERSALFSAYSMGYTKDDLLELTVIANSNNPISPCGACRQVMSELLNKDTKVTLTNLAGIEKVVTVEELLPYAFDLENEK